MARQKRPEKMTVLILAGLLYPIQPIAPYARNNSNRE
jgi:hypothetical protein